jgi:chemotaxis family two-component system response regulator Rcp1
MRRRLNVLLVEDDPGDVEITLEVLYMNDLRINIRVVENGQAALDLLQDGFHEPYRPDLILLDLNMPGMNGKELLLKIKKNQKTSRIPVIIVTTSESDDDIRFAYQHGASCFITKPRGLDQYTTLLKALENFWLTCVKFPPKN